MLSGRMGGGAAGPAAACAERATSLLLIGPDWAVNMELCDLLNADPGQTKDAMKVLKKRLGNKSPQVQYLSLFVLETLSKNCGDNVHLHIIECDILHDMVKIVKKKPIMAVREKILILIDLWQEAFEGPHGKYPQYHAAYQELRAAGVDFPPRARDSVPLFTPPRTHPLARPVVPMYEQTPVEASRQPEVSALSLVDVKSARGVAEVLNDMLSALDPCNPQMEEQISCLCGFPLHLRFVRTSSLEPRAALEYVCGRGTSGCGHRRSALQMPNDLQRLKYEIQFLSIWLANQKQLVEKLDLELMEAKEMLSIKEAELVDARLELSRRNNAHDVMREEMEGLRGQMTRIALETLSEPLVDKHIILE